MHQSDGHGLGLAIVTAVARTHHAKISAAAGPRGGLEITVAFESPSRPAQLVSPYQPHGMTRRADGDTPAPA